MGKVGAEARARVAAETDLIRRRKAEFERLLKRHDRCAAIVALVEKHKAEYGQMVTEYRHRFEAAVSAA
jgi:hypothetical protein